MKEVAFETQGSKPTIIETDVPSPAKDQILVKSLWTAMNPVDAFVANWGLNVESWPTGLGADACGIVVDAGDEARSKYNFNAGEYVCGCTRIGTREYSTCREYFLMDAAVTMRKPSNLTLPETATIGAAVQTGALGVIKGLKIPLPGSDKADADGPWVVIIGGSGSVGRAAVQLARAAGCKVIAACSKKNFDAVKALGAHTLLDYRLSLDDQLEVIDKATSGAGCTRIFDASSADDPKLAKALFRKYPSSEKLFSTTNDWSGIGSFENGNTYEIHLQTLGRPESEELNALIASWNPILTELYEKQVILPMPSHQVGSTGLHAAIEAYGQKVEGKKVVVHLQDE